MSDDASSERLPSRDAIRDTLAPSIVAEPLKSKIRAELGAAASGVIAATPVIYDVIVELNLDYPRARDEAKAAVRTIIAEIVDAAIALARDDAEARHPYVFARLTAAQIKELIKRDGAEAVKQDQSNVGTSSAQTTVDQAFPRRPFRAIFRIWESQKVRPLTTVSIRTVKADAAQQAFNASGRGVVWAVMDSGIAPHPHFTKHGNLNVDLPVQHMSFVPNFAPNDDKFGHGTHVAGIIAGEAAEGDHAQAVVQSVDEDGDHAYHLHDVSAIRGMAPECKLVSLRILDDNGIGDTIAVIQAIEYVQKINDYGRHVIIHGINVSVGYPFEAQWYACGQTPVCVEIDRLVLSGVVVVVASGNTGHVLTAVSTGGQAGQYFEAGQAMSINDPGNAALAITVGSTHKEKPHTFGISYFSSKGPTADGRRKPDVVAPGEHIISCAVGANVSKVGTDVPNGSFAYVDDTGTSMAAPHVSGIVAGFLSIRREYIGRAQDVRELVVASALDLRRDNNLQGAGLVDLMRLIQSV